MRALVEARMGSLNAAVSCLDETLSEVRAWRDEIRAELAAEVLRHAPPSERRTVVVTLQCPNRFEGTAGYVHRCALEAGHSPPCSR